jgi:tRNA1(Val) A37 N6-methylase TrmN6
MDITSERFESLLLLVFQPRKGYRYGPESLALARFCDAKAGSRIAEFGAGTAVVSMMVARLFTPRSIAAVELQDSLYRIAIKNIEENSLSKVISCTNEDWRTFSRSHPCEFDHIISNPPFYAKGSGRLGDMERAIAKHEVAGDLGELIRSVRTSLRRGGIFSAAFKNQRAEELASLAKQAGLALRRKERGAGDFTLFEFVSV